MNIPIYRAKKIQSDEYVEGDLFAGKFIIPISILNKKIFNAIKHIEEDVLSCSINEDCKNEHIELKNMLTKLIYNERLEHITEIDPTTLAIHFPNMIDSQGNKIFASLSNDGKGGDIVEFEHIRYLEDDEPSYMIKGLCLFMDSSFFVDDIDNKFDRVFYDEEGRNFRNKELKVIGIQE